MTKHLRPFDDTRARAVLAELRSADLVRARLAPAWLVLARTVSDRAPTAQVREALVRVARQLLAELAVWHEPLRADALVVAEREQQELKHPSSTAAAVDHPMAFAILTEELLEMLEARGLDIDVEAYREELVQACAVCVAWLEQTEVRRAA